MKVVLTQPDVQQAQELAAVFSERGFASEHLPLVRIEPLGYDASALYQQIQQADIVVCTSPVIPACLARNLPESAYQAIWCAPGAGTAFRLKQRYNLDVAYPLQQQNSEALLVLDCLRDVAGKKVVVLTGIGGRGVVERVLNQRQAEVIGIELYRRLPEMTNLQRIRQYSISAYIWLLSSGESLQLLHQYAENQWVEILVTSQRLAKLAEEYGYNCWQSASNKPDDIIQVLERIRRAELDTDK